MRLIKDNMTTTARIRNIQWKTEQNRLISRDNIFKKPTINVERTVITSHMNKPQTVVDRAVTVCMHAAPPPIFCAAKIFLKFTYKKLGLWFQDFGKLPLSFFMVTTGLHVFKSVSVKPEYWVSGAREWWLARFRMIK